MLFRGTSRYSARPDRRALRRARRRAERGDVAGDDGRLRPGSRHPARDTRSTPWRTWSSGRRSRMSNSEREVVLEEIAMVEDTPHDLVHDLAAEAVFGAHPLGRPVIGRAEVIASVSRSALARVPPTGLRGRARRRWRRRATSATTGSSKLVDERRNGAASVDRALPRRPVRRIPRPGLTFHRKDTEQYHVCLGGPGCLAHRRSPVRGLGAGRDRRRLRVVPPLPGDPREARHGLLRLQLHVAVRRDGAGRPLRRDARGAPRRRASRSQSRNSRISPRGTSVPTSSRGPRRT